MKQACPIERLAVALCGSEPCDLDALWGEAAKSGDLVSTGRGTLIPNRRSMRALVDVGFTYWPDWARLGFVPFLVKPAAFNPSQIKLLSAIFRTLIEVGEKDILPHWVTPHAVISLYLPDAIDLRPVCGSIDVDDAARVHSRCMDCVRRFVRLDSTLRLASLASGAETLEAFPVSARYETSVAAISQRFGSTAARGLLAAMPKQTTASPTMLFADPKPGNFIVSRSKRHRPHFDGVRAIRVDLDMLHLTSPVALQLILVLFAHPVAFEIEGDLPSCFLHQKNLLHGYCKEFGIGHEEIDAMLWYHLLRNFVGALHAGNQEKAGSMAQLLGIAGRLFDNVRVDPEFLRCVERWTAADGNGFALNRP